MTDYPGLGSAPFKLLLDRDNVYRKGEIVVTSCMKGRVIKVYKDWWLKKFVRWTLGPLMNWATQICTIKVKPLQNFDYISHYGTKLAP